MNIKHVFEINLIIIILLEKVIKVIRIGRISGFGLFFECQVLIGIQMLLIPFFFSKVRSRSGSNPLTSATLVVVVYYVTIVAVVQCTWDVEEILTYGNRLRSTHCRQFLLLEPYLVEPEGLETLGQVGVHGARVQDGTANQERPSVVCGITF